MIVVARPGLGREELAGLEARLARLGRARRTARVGGHVVYQVASTNGLAEALAWPEVEELLPDGALAELEHGRRSLLSFGVIAAAVLYVLALGLGLVAYLAPPHRAFPKDDAVYVCRDADLAEGASRELLLDERPALLLRHNGRLVAVDALCPRGEPCVLEWNAEQQVLVCPCHSSTYEVAAGGAGPLRFHRVEVIAGKVLVRSGP